MISQRCRYALKAMLNLARDSSGQSRQVSALAAEENIPRKFLEGIMSEMRQHNLVESARGKSGGYRLARPARGVRHPRPHDSGRCRRQAATRRTLEFFRAPQIKSELKSY